MTIDEAKKAGFKTGWNASTGSEWCFAWTLIGGGIRYTVSTASYLDSNNFPTRAKARDELKRRKAEASAKRVEARVAARKAAGTKAPPPETPEQRDARLKALYESYCKQGGPIVKGQLTEEMLNWCARNGHSWWNLETIGLGGFSTGAAWIIENRAFWTRADAEHDHFLRTWKGPLTEEARKNLRPDDRVWVAYSYDEAHSTTHGILLQPESAWLMEGNRLFLHEDEAKTAAHDLWLADRRENQMEAITEEQQKMLHNDDVVYIPLVSGPNPLRWALARPNGGKWDKHEFYFSEKATQAKLAKAAQAVLDKTKSTKPVEHKLPDLPSWAPPLPEGYVPLGFGGTFKVERPFGGGCSTKVSPKWDAWHMDIGWCGDKTFGFYIAPRDSEIVRLNFPWLAEGAKATTSSVTGPKDSRAGNKYHRTIHGVAGGSLVVDVYNVLDAFGVTCPACQHAIKKLLCAGLRNKGSRLQDLSEAVESASRAVTLEKQRS